MIRLNKILGGNRYLLWFSLTDGRCIELDKRTLDCNAIYSPRDTDPYFYVENGACTYNPTAADKAIIQKWIDNPEKNFLLNMPQDCRDALERIFSHISDGIKKNLSNLNIQRTYFEDLVTPDNINWFKNELKKHNIPVKI